MKDVGPDPVAVFQELRAAQESLRRLAALLAAGDDSVETPLVRDPGPAAGSEVKEAVRVFGFRGEPAEVGRVPCSFCGQMIMPAATLCGFCWRKRTPATN